MPVKPFIVPVLLFTLLQTTSNAQSNSKVTVYTDDFTGYKYELSAGKYDFMSLVRAGVSAVKSLRVPKGMKVTLYERDNFEGYALELTDDANKQYLEAKGFAKTALNVSLIVEQLPANATAGPFITIYKDDFGGTSKELGPGQYDHYELGNVGNDQLSSIKIPKGLKVTLFEHGGYQGKKLELTSDTRAPFFVSNKFNDLTSSILVEVVPEPVVVTEKPVIKKEEVKPVIKKEEPGKPVVVTTPPITVVEGTISEPSEPIIYAGDFSGASRSVGPGRYSSDQLEIGNDQLSSIKVPKGFRVKLYDGDAFEGNSVVLTKDARASWFVDNNFNNLTSSIVVEIVPMVTLYEGDYSGVSSKLEPGKYAAHEFGIGNDQLSSVRVPQGLQVTLYEDEAFGGRKLVLTHDTGFDVLTKNGFNNETSSVIVELAEKEKPMVTLFRDDFSGISKKLGAGKYQSFTELGIGDNTLSSIQIPWGMEVTLYEHECFNGRSMVLRNDANLNFFRANEFNDIVTSIVVEEKFSPDQAVIIYTEQFAGPSQALRPGRYALKDISVGDNRISSVKVPPGMRVIMFEDDNFKGYSMTAEGNVDLAQSKTFDDRVSSIVVEDLFTPIVSPVTTTPVVIPAEVKPVKKDSVVSKPAAQTPPCETTSTQFQNIVNAVKEKSFQSDKISMAKLATKGKCLNIQQIKTITEQFMNEDLSLDFVKYAYDLSNEKSEYYQLQAIFKFMSTRDSFDEFLRSK